MHQHSIVSLVLAGASMFSLANAQGSSDSLDLGDILTGFAGSAVEASPATSFSFTAHTRHTITSSPTSTSSPQANAPEKHTDDEGPDDDEDDLGIGRLVSACYPGRLENQTDWSAPCPAMQTIQGQCTWGPEAFEWLQKTIKMPIPEFLPETWEMQPPEIQRACFCSSQYAEMVLGCGACFEAHGADKAMVERVGATSNETAMSEWSKLYCDADATPTDESVSDAFEILLGHDNDAPDSSSGSSTSSSSIGNATDVSLYFTPSVSSAYIVAMPTASSSADQTHSNAWYTYTSLSTSDGQIVPTAVAGKATGGDGEDDDESGNDAATSDGSTTTAAGGAMQAAVAYSGIGAGALGVAVLALAL